MAGIVGAAVVLVLVVIGIVRCNNARVAAQQQAALEAQQQAEQQAQEQAKPTEIAGLSEGTYYIEPYDTESGVLAFDVSGVGDDAYTTVVVTELTQTTEQQIQLTVSDDGQSCTLTNGDLYLDAGDVTAGSGRSLFANKSDGGDTQRWQLQRNSDGTYSIVSLADSNLAIAVESAYDGAGVTVQDADSTDSSQHFRIVAQDRVATGSSTDDESANGNSNANSNSSSNGNSNSSNSSNSNSASSNSSSSNTSEE